MGGRTDGSAGGDALPLDRTGVGQSCERLQPGRGCAVVADHPAPFHGPPDAPSFADFYTPTPLAEDLLVGGDIPVTLDFAAGVEAVFARVTVTLLAVSPDGAATSVALDGADVLLGVLPHRETFVIAAAGTVLPAGHLIGLRVEVTGSLNVITQLEFNDGDSAMGPFTLSVLDSDGDGFGDTAERMAGTDPLDAGSRPASGAGSAGGVGDGDQHIEGVMAALLLLATMAVAGFALLGRSTS